LLSVDDHRFRQPLPAIRTDNGVPFASAHVLCRLSKLAVWWTLGIQIERIRRAHPQQTGGTSAGISH
jgi:hypothetical protein